MNRHPIIAITPGIKEDESYLVLNKHYHDVVLASGGIPVILPFATTEADLLQISNSFDGFIFSGGGDIDAAYFHEYTLPESGSISPLRDSFEISLAKILHERKDKPVLGICRGEQVLNVALDGSLYQDIDKNCDTAFLAHRQKQPGSYASHCVHITDGTLLNRIIGKSEIMVNSLHHQAVRDCARLLTQAATSPDGIAEAVESTVHPFYLGVQWHPQMLGLKDAPSKAIFDAFMDAVIQAGSNR